MGKDDDDFIKALAILAGIGAGLWLLGKALSNKKVDYYRCWNCNNLITPHTNPCPYCGVFIDWSLINQGA